MVWVLKVLKKDIGIITVSLTAQRCSLTLHHNHQGLRDRGPGHCGHLGTSLNNDLYLGLSRALVVASCAHIRATVFWTRH